MFLMAQGLEHRKTRVLEGASMAVGGGGAAVWRWGKHTFGMQKWGFT